VQGLEAEARSVDGVSARASVSVSQINSNLTEWPVQSNIRGLHRFVPPVAKDRRASSLSKMTEQTSMPSISVRKWIQWGGESCGENTDTLVLTSKKHYYVDVRIYKPTDASQPLLPNDPEDKNAISRLEWGFAGTSSSIPSEHEPSYSGCAIEGDELSHHTVWSHWIDSKTLDEVKDEGDMYPQANGDVLERGNMAHPDTGKMMDYEELWRDIMPSTTDGSSTRYSFVMKLDEPAKAARGMLIRIGAHIEGVIRIGNELSVARWHYREAKHGDGKGSWARGLVIGRGCFPLEALVSHADGTAPVLRERSMVMAGDMAWTCVEAFHW